MVNKILGGNFLKSMNSTFTELLSVAIDVPLVSFWKAIEVFLVNPRITSKNVAAIVLDGK